MTLQFTFFVVASVGLIALTNCYPSGAPEKTCEKMTANHEGHPAQNSVPKYAIKINPPTVTSGTQATVTIDGDTFKGFFIQAEDMQTRKPVGQFKSKAGVSQTRDCSGPGSATAATHVNANNKSTVTLDWVAPASFKGNVIFKAVVVKNYETFWNDIKSKPITVA